MLAKKPDLIVTKQQEHNTNVEEPWITIKIKILKLCCEGKGAMLAER